MASAGKLERFDPFIPREPWVNPWQPDASYRSDFSLLEKLLGVAVGTSQQSGVVAGAADVWAAEELRRSGFDPDEVWPRRTVPRVMAERHSKLRQSGPPEAPARTGGGALRQARCKAGPSSGGARDGTRLLEAE